jgi:UDP-N-acetylmuramate--alanine ligase
MNLKEAKKVYMVGIKGVGMTAVAEILKSWGKEVVGSDTEEKFFTDEILKKYGIKFYEGFGEKNLTAENPDLIIYSTAYTDDNEELKSAKIKNIPLLSYPEALGVISKEKECIAVCGTHGKTTTTAMLGFALKELGARPTVLVGSAVPQFGGNALAGDGKNIVIEADEYQNKFLSLNPLGIILTSIEYDHPDFFKTEEDYILAFKNFIKKIPRDGFLIACFDDKKAEEISESVDGQIISYGLNSGEWRARNIRQEEEETIFDVFKNNVSQGTFRIKLFGNHNTLNALAVIAVCHHLGYDSKLINAALEKFLGTVRRFEIKGEVNGVTIIDDYGHHPTEIKVTLEVARRRYPENRIWCVFHPHTFSRTKALFSDFVKSFDNADKIIVLDVYGSAREKAGEVSSRDLAEEIKKQGKDALYLATIPEAVDFLAGQAEAGDVVITMGAGDVWRVGEKLKTQISKVKTTT